MKSADRDAIQVIALCWRSSPRRLLPIPGSTGLPSHHHHLNRLVKRFLVFIRQERVRLDTLRLSSE